jgi:hypothetical protein
VLGTDQDLELVKKSGADRCWDLIESDSGSHREKCTGSSLKVAANELSIGVSFNIPA